MIQNKMRKIILILVFIITLGLIFPSNVKAYTLKNRAALIKAENLGQTVRMCQAANYWDDLDVICQCRISDHVYCVEHTDGTVDDVEDFTVKAYVRIEGDLAYGSMTSNDNPVQSQKNLTLAYLLTQDSGTYPMGYDPSSDFTMRRTRAIHKHLCSGGWHNDVGKVINSNLSSWVNGWDGSWWDGYTEVCNFITKAETEAKKDSNKAPYVNASAKTVYITQNTNWSGNNNPLIGPFNLTFNGTLNKLDLGFVEEDGSHSANSSDIVIRQSNTTKKINEITSGVDFYIVNGTGKTINKLTATSTNKVLKAQLWFLQYDNYVQKYMIAETGTVNKTSNECTINVKYRGSLTIQKRDGDSKSTGIAGVGFKIKSSYNNGTWLKGDGSSDYEHVSESNATIYTTDSSGNLTISNLPSGRNYRVFEVSAPTNLDYHIEAQPNYDKDKGYIDCGLIKVSSTDLRHTVGPIYNYKTGYLTIYKRDVDSKDGLKGAGFKIKTSAGTDTWLSGTKAPYTYDASYENATIYYIKDNYYKTGDTVERVNTTDENWKTGIKISHLKQGTYSLYEVVPPTGYLLEHQDNYNAEKGYVDTRQSRTIPSVVNNNNVYSVGIGISNVQKISIAGRVWEEGYPDKGSIRDYDSIYSDVDKKLSGITVKLIKKGTTSPIATTTTNSDGMYLFDSLIKKKDLENYYVEFDYSSKCTGNVRYIPVAFYKDNNKTNGSKAITSTMPYKDEEVVGKATTYTGTNSTQISTYGLNAVGSLDSSTLTLNNINLGIKPLLDPEYDISESLAEIVIKIKGYNYKYTYEGEEKEPILDGPTVSTQNTQIKSAYSKPMYPSDIIYDIESSKKELEALVKYRIDITNDTTYDIKELYQQTDKLILTSIKDQFDKNRYTLADNNWTADNNVATMKQAYLDSIQTKNGVKGVGKEETITAYITFSVNEKALADILEHPDGIVEDYPTKIITKAYHDYHRDGYFWENLGKTETNINGEKITNKLHRTRELEKNSDAPYLVFKLKPGGSGGGRRRRRPAEEKAS